MSLPRKLAYLQQALALQWAPPQALAALQLRALRHRLASAETVPLYRESFAEAGVRASDLRTLEDLSAFPTLRREDAQAAWPDGILSRPPRPDDVVFRTSGTSGLFMRIAYDAAANDRLDAIYARALFATGYRPWHRFAYFWWEDRPKEPRLYERLGLMRKSFVPVDPDPAVQLRAIRAIGPDYVYHFPSSLRMLARLVEQEGLGDLRPRGVVCHGELCPPEIADEVARAFRCPVWNQYGAQEFNRLGWDCARHAGMHLDADSVVLEVLGPDGRPVPDGEEGELVFTGLHNDLMPLVRYRIGDLGRKIRGRCACGRGLPLFEVTEGRRDDVLTFPGGRQIGPRSIAPRVESVRGLLQYRVVQKAPDRLEVLFVAGPDAEPSIASDVRDALRRAVGDEIAIHVVPVAGIPLSRRGKLRKVVSELGADAGA